MINHDAVTRGYSNYSQLEWRDFEKYALQLFTSCPSPYLRNCLGTFTLLALPTMS